MLHSLLKVNPKTREHIIERLEEEGGDSKKYPLISVVLTCAMP